MDRLAGLSAEIQGLLPLAEPARKNKKLPVEQLKGVIQQLCQSRWLSTPAKQAPAKKAPAKKVPSKKVPAKKAAPPQAQAKAALASESKEFSRVKTGLSKMGDKAPHKLKSFLRHVQAMLGKDSTAGQIDAMVQQLEKVGLVQIAGDLVLYDRA